MSEIVATTYTVYPTGWTDDAAGRGGYFWCLRIEQRSAGRWVVTDGFDVYTSDGREDEPIPSSRTDEFKARTRMSLDDAKALALQLIDGRRINGRTFAEILEATQ